VSKFKHMYRYHYYYYYYYILHCCSFFFIFQYIIVLLFVIVYRRIYFVFINDSKILRKECMLLKKWYKNLCQALVSLFNGLTRIGPLLMKRRRPLHRSITILQVNFLDFPAFSSAGHLAHDEVSCKKIS
jgi:amino acid transporter